MSESDVETAENGEEPTMEEILASIRRIISEDEEAPEEPAEELAVEEPGEEGPGMDSLGDFDADELDTGADIEPVEEPGLGTLDDDFELETSDFQLDDDTAADVAPEAAAVEEDPFDSLGDMELDEDEDDVLELTEIVEDDDDMDAEASEDDIDAIMAAAEEEDAEPEPEPEAAPEFEPEPEPAVMDDFEPAHPAEGLVSDQPAAQTSTHFANFAGALSATRGVPVGAGNKTLEELVKELLRPMLREWLDDNLPPMVERLVEREINKLAGYSDDK